MRFKKQFISLFLVVMLISLLNACSIRLVNPNSNLPPTLPIETSAMLTVTAMSVSSPTSTMTPAPLVTFMPTPTVTLFYDSTVTPTPKWSTCPGFVITAEDTKAGDILHVHRCEDKMEYNLGPIARGFYAVGPNNKFLVYVTYSGIVYAARIGDQQLNKLYDLGREHIFTVFNKRVTPDFEITFAGELPIYTLVLIEKNYNQKRVYELPTWITQ